jgi:hypothetical protein
MEWVKAPSSFRVSNATNSQDLVCTGAANASRHKAMSYDRMCAMDEKWDGEIPQIKDQIDAAAAANPPLSPSKLIELQKDLAIREKRLPVIKASKAVLEEEAKEKVAKERRLHEEKALQQGKKPRKKVWKTKPDAKAQRNFTASKFAQAVQNLSHFSLGILQQAAGPAATADRSSPVCTCTVSVALIVLPCRTV